MGTCGRCGLHPAPPAADLCLGCQRKAPRVDAAKRYSSVQARKEAFRRDSPAEHRRQRERSAKALRRLDEGWAEGRRRAPFGRPVDPAGWFYKDPTGTVRFSFGKNKGKAVTENPGMLRWMLRKDFPAATKRVARELLQGA